MVVHWAKKGKKEIRKKGRKNERRKRESEMGGCSVTLLGSVNEVEIKKGRKRE